MSFENKTVKQQLLPLEAPPSSRLAVIRRFCVSTAFMWLEFLCGAAFMLTDHAVASSVFFLALISALLFICDDVLTTTLPFLLLCISVLVCYDSFDTFIKFVRLAPLPLSALIFHFVRYARPFTVGDSLWGHVGVSVAVILGGIGAIGPDDYFSGSSVYYVTMLGVGLLATYVLMKSQLRPRADYDIREKLITVMLIAGIFACLEVAYLVCRVSLEFSLSFGQFAEYFLKTTGSSQSIDPAALPLIERIMQPSNNLSTFLMMLLPVTFYRTVRKNVAYSLVSLLFLAGLFFTKSRSGLLLGGVEAGGDERLEDLFRDGGGGAGLAEAEDVRAVVGARDPRVLRVAAERRAHVLKAVRGHRHSHAGRAHEHPEVCISASHRLRYGVRVVGIVATFRRVRPDVHERRLRT